ncbi:MAG: SNase-like nuclease [Cytophagales bacterium CG18_big_fil_WC_8_21_14_2_50_42_9]|nr:MAG: SNase-like nuclease [Cytophagales bacterium CG18_big_fil_WC_8_21_14_2_50_42_9]
MKNLTATYLYYLFLCLLLACKQIGKSTEEATVSGYKVISIKDGDTIELLKDGQPVRVRLQGVDAPEKKQDFGTRSRQFTSDLSFGQYVNLVVDGTDRYGRTVGTIILPDGRTLNQELVRNGFAWHYKAYSKDEELARLEEEARAEKRGLWAGPNPIAPWDFRKKGRTANTEESATEKPAKIPITNTSKVFICDSKGAKTYHVRENCSVLNRCKSERQTLTLKKATALGRKACQVCSR